MCNSWPYIFHIYRKQFRTLFAGDGTGLGVSYIAEQLNETNAEIVYLDFSSTSMKIAKTRVKARSAYNVIWITGWIETIPKLGLGKFEMTMCSGVLHHLKNPTYGLKTLKTALLPGGGGHFMVYGKYGRLTIYQIQTLATLINKNSASPVRELANVRHVIRAAPASNWFEKMDENFKKVNLRTDSDIYDMFLHKRDISFAVLDLYNWVQKSGLKITYFCNEDWQLTYYNNYHYITKTFNPRIRKIIKSDPIKKRMIREHIQGQLVIKQSIYLNKEK